MVLNQRKYRQPETSDLWTTWSNESSSKRRRVDVAVDVVAAEKGPVRVVFKDVK
jgi:hypothetical protein